MKTNSLCRMLFAAAIAFSLTAHAQDYPSKLVKVIVPVAPGGGPDVFARVLVEKLSEKWGQPVIVENRAGVAGNICMEAASKAAPDGYTLVFAHQPPLVINKSLYAKLSYDPDAFAPISVVVAVPMVVVVHPKVQVQTVQQLIAYAKANPDRLNYASAGSGSTPHLAAEFFKSRTGVRIVHVPYKSNAPAVGDLLGGQVDLMMLDLGSVLQHARTGKLRPLAVLTEKRNPALPDVPAMSEILPGLVVSPWWGMVAPPKTPAAIAERVSATVAEALKHPDVAKRLTDMGNLVAVGSTPAEMVRFLKVERERWGNLIRAIGATAD
ncbi:MAG: tripartite tricarboxylate transporter substrate binding protein [Betaproteobacteria bacterium]|nr:tripartite tricarboxylate transporter substrate binding protein [Betaproteobacteria bacterium]